MKIEWNAAERELTIDGETFVPENHDDGPVEVPVRLLRRIRGTDLPLGASVMGVRRVIGSTRGVYSDPEGVSFLRLSDTALLAVEEVQVVDADDVPEDDERCRQLSQAREVVLDELHLAKEAGLVTECCVADADDEHFTFSYSVPVSDPARSIYDLLHSAPSLVDGTLLPEMSDVAVLAALRRLPLLHGDERPFLHRFVSPLSRLMGYPPDALLIEYRTSDADLDAVIKPYETDHPLLAYEVETAQGRTLDQRERLLDEVLRLSRARAAVLCGPSVFMVRSPNGSLALAPSTATLDHARKVLALISKPALAAEVAQPLSEAQLDGITKALEAADVAASPKEKGLAYENLASVALELIRCLRAKHRRLSTDTSEIDLIMEYVGEPKLALLEQVGRYVMVECKNWSAPADAATLRDFIGKMQAARVKLGIVFSRAGVTGSHGRGARGVIRTAYQQDGTIVLVLTHEDLRAVARGEDLARLLDRRCDSVIFQSG